jgi:hypothetical protein
MESSTDTALRQLEAAAEPHNLRVPEILGKLAALLEGESVFEAQRELTAAEREVLEEQGLGEMEPEPDAALRAFGAELELFADAYDAAGAAKKLGVSTSRVRQLLGSGRLYGVKQGRDWCLPRWQFRARGKGTVPGIDAVIHALPPDLHPVSVFGFMTNPKPELVLDAEPVSPLRWLAGGGDPAPVARLAREL